LTCTCSAKTWFFCENNQATQSREADDLLFIQTNLPGLVLDFPVKDFDYFVIFIKENEYL